MRGHGALPLADLPQPPRGLRVLCLAALLCQHAQPPTHASNSSTCTFNLTESGLGAKFLHFPKEPGAKRPNRQKSTVAKLKRGHRPGQRRGARRPAPSWQSSPHFDESGCTGKGPFLPVPAQQSLHHATRPGAVKCSPANVQTRVIESFFRSGVREGRYQQISIIRTGTCAIWKSGLAATRAQGI